MGRRDKRLRAVMFICGVLGFIYTAMVIADFVCQNTDQMFSGITIGMAIAFDLMWSLILLIYLRVINL